MLAYQAHEKLLVGPDTSAPVEGRYMHFTHGEILWGPQSWPWSLSLEGSDFDNRYQQIVGM